MFNCCLISAKDFFRRLFGEESRTFDYKWLRYFSLLSFMLCQAQVWFYVKGHEIYEA
jgi:hypothetical protein